MLRSILILALAVIVTGCSIGRQNETYDTSGALLSRNYESWQLGTTRQATMNASQQDGESIYELNIGESVDTSDNFIEVLRVPADTATSLYGLGQLRRADALAPVSVNSFGSTQAQPITAEQQAVLDARINALLQARLAEIAAEQAAAEAAAHGGAE